MRTRDRQANLALWAINAEGFLSRLSFGLISFMLPLYALHLGLSLTEIGFLVSLDLTAALALKPMMGWAADRFGLKRSLIAAIGVRSLVALLLAFAGVPWQLYAIRTLHGMSKALRDPSADALIAEHGGKKAMASAFAWYQTAKSVAGSLGKALAGLLLGWTASNYPLVFTFAFVLSTLPLYVVARYLREEGPPTGAVTRASKDALVEIAPHGQGSGVGPRPAVIPYMGMAFLISGTAQMLHGLFPILATEYAGLNEAETGSLYLAATLAVLFAGPVFGWLSDNVSRQLVFLVRSAANVLSSLVYIIAPNLPGVVVGKLVDDMGKAAFRPAWGALMAHVSSYDRRRRAQAMSIMSLGEDAGTIAGPILAGFLWNTWGLTAALGVRVGLAVVTEVYTALLTRSLEKSKQAVVQPVPES